MDSDLPPRLDPLALRAALTPPWRYLDVVEETGSTNADLVARAAAGENVGGVVLIAEHQTAGRGRMGRHWSAAPRAQITMSVGVDAAAVPMTAWGWLPLATGVAVADTVAECTAVRAGLKWPNDVMVGGAKLAGILAEVCGQLIVVGIGLNVTLRARELGEAGAISLGELDTATPDRTQLTAELLRRLADRVSCWQAGGGADERLLADYRRECVSIGATVRATLPGGRDLVGTAESVDAQGRLCINADGETVAVSAGDVVQLRPST